MTVAQTNVVLGTAPATSSTFGVIKVDGTSLKATSGVAAANPVTSYAGQQGTGSSSFTSAANQIRGVSIQIHWPVTFSHLALAVNTLDATNHYSAALADTSGNALCHPTSGQTIPSANVALVNSCNEGTVTLNPGTYILLWTCDQSGTSTGAYKGISSSNVALVDFTSNSVSGCSSSTGVISFASPCTISLSSASLNLAAVPNWELY
jgi:hypothetical protein